MYYAFHDSQALQAFYMGEKEADFRPASPAHSMTDVAALISTCGLGAAWVRMKPDHAAPCGPHADPRRWFSHRMAEHTGGTALSPSSLLASLLPFRSAMWYLRGVWIGRGKRPVWIW